MVRIQLYHDTERQVCLDSSLVKVVPTLGIGEGIQWMMEEGQLAPSWERKHLRREQEHKGR